MFNFSRCNFKSCLLSLYTWFLCTPKTSFCLYFFFFNIVKPQASSDLCPSPHRRLKLQLAHTVLALWKHTQGSREARKLCTAFIAHLWELGQRSCTATGDGEGKTISQVSHFYFEQFGLWHPWTGGGTWPWGAKGKEGTFLLSKIPPSAGESDPDTAAHFVLFSSQQHLQDLNGASRAQCEQGASSYSQSNWIMHMDMDMDIDTEIDIDIYRFLKKPSECQIRVVFIRGGLLPEPSSPSCPRALFCVPSSIFTQSQVLVRAGETIGISLPWALKKRHFFWSKPWLLFKRGPSFGKKQKSGVEPSQGKPGEIPVSHWPK